MAQQVYENQSIVSENQIGLYAPSFVSHIETEVQIMDLNYNDLGSLRMPKRWDESLRRDGCLVLNFLAADNSKFLFGRQTGDLFARRVELRVSSYPSVLLMYGEIEYLAAHPDVAFFPSLYTVRKEISEAINIALDSRRVADKIAVKED